ncbi:hypothetical protein KIN20_028489 [Parelaphostrongylus tenuis]|uniref:Uncharacterized protein n=1 Tax=Parelaphostrongylus tenuis TaxID=148309 RepID=A0AAD5R153_PARTN|nr:hypothetical protein KIN20_028489 [Parelaphostrongylus tenuis]
MPENLVISIQCLYYEKTDSPQCRGPFSCVSLIADGHAFGLPTSCASRCNKSALLHWSFARVKDLTRRCAFVGGRAGLLVWSCARLNYLTLALELVFLCGAALD